MLKKLGNYVSPTLTVINLLTQDVVTASDMGIKWNSKWSDSWEA